MSQGGRFNSLWALFHMYIFIKSLNILYCSWKIITVESNNDTKYDPSNNTKIYGCVWSMPVCPKSTAPIIICVPPKSRGPRYSSINWMIMESIEFLPIKKNTVFHSIFSVNILMDNMFHSIFPQYYPNIIPIFVSKTPRGCWIMIFDAIIMIVPL